MRVKVAGVNERRLYVVYGKPDGARVTFTQLEAGQGGTVRPLLSFVSAVARADFDGDGLADFAIGLPGVGTTWGRVEVHAQADGAARGKGRGGRFHGGQDPHGLRAGHA